MNIDFISILLFLGIGQCLFIMFTIGIGKQQQKTANRLLMGLLFAFLWYQVEFFLLRHTLDAQIPFIYSTRYGSWLIIGPLILLYNRAILIQNFQLKKQDAWHFLPFLLFTVLLPLIFGSVITHRAVNYGMLTVFDEWNRETITFRHYLYGGIFLLQFIHAMIYTLFAYREMTDIVGLAKKQKSNIPTDKINTLKYLYISACIIILLCSGFVVNQFLTVMWMRTFDYFYVLPTLIFVFGLAYRAIKYPNSVLILEEEIKKEKYAKSGLTESVKKAYLERLDEKMQIEKMYRNNELRISDLAEAMNMSVHHLSQLLNEEKEQNFFDFVNTFRVQEAKEIISQGEYRTLLEVAFAVGFNNKNSFNTAFKKYTKMTPSAYRKSS